METTLFSAAGNKLFSRASWNIGFLHPSPRTEPAIGEPERTDQNNHEKRKHKSKPHRKKLSEQEHYSVKNNGLANCEK